MPFLWAILHREAIRPRPATRRGAFDDPLERPEWRGLAWIFARPRRRSSLPDPTERCMAPHRP